MAADLWAQFAHDPRQRAHAGLRCSVDDRERIHTVLSEAYADGRLERDELDDRMAATARARTLGELPPLVADLVPLRTPAPRPAGSLVGVPHDELRRRAEDEWAARRRSALTFLVSAVVVSSALFVARGVEWETPWLALVSLLAVLRVSHLQVGHRDIVATQVRRLEKKQARQQRQAQWPWPKGLPPGPWSP
ncbi:DUF1707 SHOCT-like domain-containing protein [Nocardioides litoris]|uniref:DUF1707 SHOCT-like domain-containing protein n=1 Tax=Nocardioides litoris TaxID=1926648 RepID=UPI001476DE55|nr:DUF1707 domain-containing protein [Nocardioides litoris]